MKCVSHTKDSTMRCVHSILVLSITIILSISPAFAERDPGPGPASTVGMELYDYTQNAQPPSIGPNGLNNQYADGMNLYQYIGSNPVNWLDPTGTLKELKTITIKRKKFEGIYVGWGHWWVELNGRTSFGWWPVKLDVTVREAWHGVPGEINGVTNHGGTATRDPYHGEKADITFHPFRTEGQTKGMYWPIKNKPCRCVSENDIRICIQNFKEDWKKIPIWRFLDRSCWHFQWKMMKACCMTEKDK